ncbi:MAG: hypothetical protein GWN99_13860 [Gemmatimonadetes bacterium]|uniref:Solute-binding protein family 5 domain-containing protein n=1 Tax=Candidatus Kutchimonas denitrificans TaxID=3056748 RepID=A0AAE4ZAQ2_9BACT|nr:hypothetical protein [Gemmatimonadota bacterium]NIR75306.1 hypothetical protein [Candidatus Kutchimonas denitrificans]NIS02132.1 hypothetical protein [Gemmatimonadota bacterium]NIT67957.1 hypothetical protein [Gemmatimonadota bacterium]NIU53951.1 hypothetical protein [Gemmatimonadota bacterium]
MARVGLEALTAGPASWRRRVVAGLALALAAGCGAPAAERSVVIAVSSDVGILLPAAELTTLDAAIGNLLYLGLNSARWNDGAIEYRADEMSLADSWTPESDSTVLVYHLKPDAVWSDGVPITARDVVFSYELIRAPGVASRYASFWAELDSVVARGQHDVAFHFRRPHPRMLLHSGLSIMPAHIFEGTPANTDALAGHRSLSAPDARPVVSGPFLVRERRPGERLVLEPNRRSVAGRPWLERVVFRVQPDPATRVIALESGRVDVIDPVPLARAGELAAAPDIRVETTGLRYYEYIAWNGRRFAPFREPTVRRALSLAIDRPGVLAGLGIEEFASPAAGPATPLFPELIDPAVRPDPFLPDSARALLRAAGWRDSDGDDVLDRDGVPFQFVLVTQADNERRRAAAEIIQAQLAAIGVATRLRALERNALLDLVYNRKDFEAALVGWGVTLEPDYLADQFWPADAQYNITGYRSVALDSLVPRARSARTDEEARPRWRAVGVQIARDRPYAFLWFYTEAVALRERVQNVRIDVYGVYQNLHRWRLEPAAPATTSRQTTGDGER